MTAKQLDNHSMFGYYGDLCMAFMFGFVVSYLWGKWDRLPRKSKVPPSAPPPPKPSDMPPTIYGSPSVN